MAYTGNVFTFQHNWAQPLRERLQLPCDVLIADDGTEQRRSLRLNPLRSYEFQVLLSESAMRFYFDALLHTSLTEEVLIPIRHDRRKLTSQLSAGATSLSFDTEYLDYDDTGNCYILFIGDYNNYEAVEVTAVDGSGIEFDATETTWPAGTPYFPARPANYDPQVQGTRFGTDRKIRTVKFDILPTSKSTNRYGSFTWSQKSSLDMWLEHSATKEQESSIVHDADAERTLTGLWHIASRKAAPYYVFDHDRLMDSRAEIAEWLAFWKSRYGRRVPFWVPSWDHDFDVISYNSGTNRITWTENGYTQFYNAMEGRAHVFIYKNDGTHVNVTLSAPVNNGDGTESATCGGGFFVADINRASFLRYCRLEADALEIDWHSTGIAQSSTQFRELFITP